PGDDDLRLEGEIDVELANVGAVGGLCAVSRGRRLEVYRPRRPADLVVSGGIGDCVREVDEPRARRAHPRQRERAAGPVAHGAEDAHRAGAEDDLERVWRRAHLRRAQIDDDVAGETTRRLAADVVA